MQRGSFFPGTPPGGIEVPKPNQVFPSSRIVSSCPACHHRLFLDGERHDIYLEPTAGLMSPRPIICPNTLCQRVLVLHHNELHVAPKGTKVFAPRGGKTPRLAHTSANTRPRSGRIFVSSPPAGA